MILTFIMKNIESCLLDICVCDRQKSMVKPTQGSGMPKRNPASDVVDGQGEGDDDL